MNVLDFISDSPRNYIFHKTSNKTKFGGILTLIYIFVLILIIVGYLYDYFVNKQYEFGSYYKYLDDEEKEKEENEFNPMINFTYFIWDGKMALDIKNKSSMEKLEEFNKKFIACEYNKFFEDNSHICEEIIFGDGDAKKINDIKFIIGYRCKNKYKCLEQKEGDEEYYNYNPLMFSFLYLNKILDYENDDFPVIDGLLRYDIIFNPFDVVSLNFDWNVFNFEEKMGIFSRIMNLFLKKKTSDYYGSFTMGEKINIKNNFNYGIKYSYNNSIHYMKPFLVIQTENDLEGKTIYYRTGVSILDYIANIAALAASLFNILSKAYSLIYSKNFDNYKIIEKILSKEIKKPINLNLKSNIDTYSSYDKNIKIQNLENNTLTDEENYNKENLIINESENSEDLNNNEKEEQEEIEEIGNLNHNENIINKLPRLRFFDFIFNNIYCGKSCKFSKKQNLINSTNEILYYYFSVENILYNQIKFECLMEDYIWNNPELKSIQKNNLIAELRKHMIIK